MPAKHAFANSSESLPSPSAMPEQNQQTDAETARAAYAFRLRQETRTLRQLWRICDQRVCKRARRCCASYVFCEKYDLQRLAKRDKTHQKT
jgi:hypothetical protein